MQSREFELKADFAPAGDQPAAVAALVDGLANGIARQTLLGVTGSGKTFTMAGVIQGLQRPALIALKDYERQKDSGRKPVFDPEALGIRHAELWHGLEVPDETADHIRIAR